MMANRGAGTVESPRDETEKHAGSTWMCGPSASMRRKARRASTAHAGNRRRRLKTWMCEFGAGLRLPRSEEDRVGRSRHARKKAVMGTRVYGRDDIGWK